MIDLEAARDLVEQIRTNTPDDTDANRMAGEYHAMLGDAIAIRDSLNNSKYADVTDWIVAFDAAEAFTVQETAADDPYGIPQPLDELRLYVRPRDGENIDMSEYKPAVYDLAQTLGTGLCSTTARLNDEFEPILAPVLLGDRLDEFVEQLGANGHPDATELTNAATDTEDDA